MFKRMNVAVLLTRFKIVMYGRSGSLFMSHDSLFAYTTLKISMDLWFIGGSILGYSITDVNLNLFV